MAYRDQYRAFFEHSLAALFITRPDGSILDANRVSCDLFGYSPEEFRQLNRNDIIDPNTPGLNRMIRQRSETGKIAGELICRHKNGGRFFCDFSSVEFVDDDGAELNSLLLIDVTDRKISQEHLRNIVEYSTNMFYTHNLQGEVTYVSPQSTDFLGYSPEELNHQWTDFVTGHPANKTGREYTRKALETGLPQPLYELQMRKKDGSAIWVAVNEAPVVRDGKVIGMIGSLTDITDRKTAELESEQNRLLLAKLTDQARALVWVREEKGRHIFVNREFCRLFGIDHDQVIGSTIGELFDLETARQFRENDRRVLESGEPEVFEQKVSTKEGERYYRTEIFPLDGVPGFARLLGSISIDVTERKESEEYIRESLAEKSTLLAEIHHRVKNNLAVVSSLMQLQAMNADNEELKQQFGKAIHRINSMASIHDQLYQSESFSRFPFSKGVRTLIQNIVESFQVQTRFTVRFDLDPVELNINQAVPCSLLTNEVITNIIKHGFDERSEGEIMVRLRENEREVTFTVEDNGNGLPDNFSENTHNTLGLVLIDLLTRQLKGERSYQDTKSGAKFTLTFTRTDQKGSSSFFV